MSQSLLLTTTTEGLQPLGTASQRSFELVTGTVRDHLGERHAAIFAEPMISANGDRIDWHHDGNLSGLPEYSTPPVPLADLTDDAQDTIRTELGEISRDIAKLADELEAGDDAQDLRLAMALRNALEVPNQDSIFVVDGARPVLVNWAWTVQGNTTVRGLLTGMAPAARFAPNLVPQQSQEPVSRPIGPWWWLILLGWLLLALLIATILYLLIFPCGLRDGRVIFCPQPQEAALLDGAQTRVLEGEISDLERELARASQMCQPDYSGLEVPVTDENEVTRRLKERGGQQGDLGFSLTWNSKDDLDLEVTCPNGVRIDFRSRTGCNGQLDVDANVSPEDATNDPIENVFFVDPATGPYEIRVRLSQLRTDKPTRFTLRVTQRDGNTQNFTASVSKSGRDWKKTIAIRE